MRRANRRRIEYRPRNRRQSRRRFWLRRSGLRPVGARAERLLRAVLAGVIAVTLLLSVRVIARSARTRRLNGKLAAIYAEGQTTGAQAPEAQVAAPAIGEGFSAEAEKKSAKKPMVLSQMTLPDGSPIEDGAAGETAAFHVTGGDVLPQMQKLLEANSETVGWLNIPGVVHLPVVYRDNTYYLSHDFSGHGNESGALFLDEGHPLTAQAQNLLIHGHSMYDGSMFGLLTHYRKLDGLLKHPLVSFSTLWQQETYAVFAVLLVPADADDPDAFDYYSHPGFPSDAAFEAYIDEACRRSLYKIPVSVRPSDALLTLSTCIGDDRLAVLARRMRPDETKDELISAVSQSVGM